MPKSLTRALLTLLMLSGLAFGQGTWVLAGTTGGIQGTVTSASGSPVASVQISVVAPSYSIKTVTGSNGFYALAGLPPDTYTVTFTAPGYTAVAVSGVTVNQDQTVALNHTLTADVKVLGKQTVRGTTSLLQPKATVDQYTVTSQTIQNITGTLSATYDNTLANYNSDFFPATNNAALALNHFFHVSYVAPVVATLNLAYDTHNGWHFSALVPYESGYRYGVGKKTFVFQPIGPNGGLVPVEVLNTDLAATSLGQNAFQSAYYFTDPSNPGTILHPNVTGSRGTSDGADPGTLKGPPRFFLTDVTVAHDVGRGATSMQIGIRGTNLLGNYTNSVVGTNSRYRNNGLGGYGPTSGTNLVLPTEEPYQFPRSPNPYENEPTGPARLYTLFVSVKY